MSEEQLDLDGDGVAESVASDTNNDGLVDTVEADTDGDGVADLLVSDADFDGYADSIVSSYETDTAEVAGVDSAAEVSGGDTSTDAGEVTYSDSGDAIYTFPDGSVSFSGTTAGGESIGYNSDIGVVDYDTGFDAGY